jgi:hypothetical protein
MIYASMFLLGMPESREVQGIMLIRRERYNGTGKTKQWRSQQCLIVPAYLRFLCYIASALPLLAPGGRRASMGNIANWLIIAATTSSPPSGPQCD